MPVILKIEQKDGQRTAVWEITEAEFTLLEAACLNKTDFTVFSSITDPGRRLEWLAVRTLLREFYPAAPTIEYLETGKPLLVNHTDRISISHSGNMVAIALHSGHSPGIDIEMIHPRIFKIAGRFLSESEREYVGAEPSAEQLTIIWGAKEVLFKIYEHGGVTFKNELIVKSFIVALKGSLEGVIHKDNTRIAVPMEYRKMGNFILVQTDYNGDFEKNTDL